MIYSAVYHMTYLQLFLLFLVLIVSVGILLVQRKLIDIQYSSVIIDFLSLKLGHYNKSTVSQSAVRH